MNWRDVVAADEALTRELEALRDRLARAGADFERERTEHENRTRDLEALRGELREWEAAQQDVIAQLRQIAPPEPKPQASSNSSA